MQKMGLTVVILAAGKGTRMKSAQAKVLHEVLFKPMIHHVLDAVQSLEPERIVVIVGHQKEKVAQALQGYEVVLVEQKEQLGTGHAVLMAEKMVSQETGNVMILCGDTPLISAAALQGMVTEHTTKEAALTVMTTELENPFGYGRIITEGSAVKKIVEQKECTEEQKAIQEINSGIYMVDRDLLFEGLHQVTPDNSQGEFYLTDIVAYGVERGEKVQKYCNTTALEVLGVNSRVELEMAHQYLKEKRNQALMMDGVALLESLTTTIDPLAEVGRDTCIMPCVGIYGRTRIGEGCCVEHGAVLRDCTVHDGAHIGAHAVLIGCTIEENERVQAGTLREG